MASIKKIKPLVSVVIPIYKPVEETLSLLRDSLKKQTIPLEIVEKWNNPEAVSINLGIKEARGEFIIILAQDCVPENEFFAEKIIKPLEDKNVVGVVSDLLLPEKDWMKRPFLARMFTMGDLKMRKPDMNLSSCAFRKKDLKRINYVREDVSAGDYDFAKKIMALGKIEKGNVTIHHLHPHYDYIKLAKTFYSYSKFNGLVVRNDRTNTPAFLQRIIRATPFLGFCSIYFRYPLKKYYYLLPIHLLFGAIPEHIINVIGFWHGFFLGDDEGGSRNKEVLSLKSKEN